MYELAGGSGGYIYVSTVNVYANNTIDEKATISANGGNGFLGSLSGSGGVIVFDKNFTIPVDQVSAYGGLVDNQTGDGCGNGAAGSIWYRTEDSLIIKNNKTITDKMTVIKIPQTT